MDRYFLDIRGGCAAVRDRQHPGYDEDYPGLHRVMLDVVWPDREKKLKELGI